MRILITCWAVLPVLALLLSAIYRLGQHVLTAVAEPLSIMQWGVLLLGVVYMLYAEGYKGFHKAFAPRFAARVLHVRDQGTVLQRLFAPVFTFGYFDSTPRRLIATYALTTMIVCCVMLLSYVPQPWRGIIDTGVVAGLILGVASLIYFLYRALRDPAYPHSPELPRAMRIS